MEDLVDISRKSSEIQSARFYWQWPDKEILTSCWTISLFPHGCVCVSVSVYSYIVNLILKLYVMVNVWEVGHSTSLILLVYIPGLWLCSDVARTIQVFCILIAFWIKYLSGCCAKTLILICSTVEWVLHLSDCWKFSVSFHFLRYTTPVIRKLQII